MHTIVSWMILGCVGLTMLACGGDGSPAGAHADAAATPSDASVAVGDDASLTPEDAGSGSGSDAAIDKSARCAESFGSMLTAPFGRLDGQVLAIVSPGNERCTRPNGDHVIVQVLAGGEAYRIVVNVLSDRGEDRDLRFRSLEHALVGPAFAEGWHTDVALDYVDDLGVHSNQAEWQPQDMPTLVRSIEDAITLDDHIAAYAGTRGGDSAHLVHRNDNGEDGALVLNARGEAPRWLLFHFAEQSF